MITQEERDRIVNLAHEHADALGQLALGRGDAQTVDALWWKLLNAVDSVTDWSTESAHT